MFASVPTNLPGPAAPGDVEGPWDRRRRVIAREIEEVALRLFVERGFDDVTAEDIARAAGVAERTFYRYFASKSDVILAMPRRATRAMCAAVLARPKDETVLEAWRAATTGRGPWDESDLRLATLYKETFARSPVATRISGDESLLGDIVQTVAIRLGADPADLQPAVLGGAIRAAMVAALDRWSAADADELGRLMGDAFDVLTAVGGERRGARASRRR